MGISKNRNAYLNNIPWGCRVWPEKWNSEDPIPLPSQLLFEQCFYIIANFGSLQPYIEATEISYIILYYHIYTITFLCSLTLQHQDRTLPPQIAYTVHWVWLVRIKAKGFLYAVTASGLVPAVGRTTGRNTRYREILPSGWPRRFPPVVLLICI